MSIKRRKWTSVQKAEIAIRYGKGESFAKMGEYFGRTEEEMRAMVENLRWAGIIVGLPNPSC